MITRLLDRLWPVHPSVQELASDMRKKAWPFLPLYLDRGLAVVMSRFYLDQGGLVPSRAHAGAQVIIRHGGLVVVEGLFGRWSLNWRERALVRRATLGWLEELSMMMGQTRG